MNVPLKNVKKIHIAIVDDQKLFPEGFAHLLKEYDDFKIEIATTQPHKLLSFLNVRKVDIVITDLAMPEMDGITLTEKIKKNFPSVKVMVLTMYNDERYLMKIIEKGANAFLTKDADMENIINAIYGVFDDQYYFNNNVSKAFLNHYLRQRDSYLQCYDTENKKLSEKEIEIIRLICQEYTSKEIAERLAISYSTVITYRERIMSKIGAKNLAGIVMYAVKNGII